MKKAKRNITYIPDNGDLDLPYCTGAEFMDATATVVSTLSRNSETRVSFAGDGAYTNGHEVNLPALPEDATITKRQGLVTGGYANHEALHNLLTEFGGDTASMCRQWGADGRKFTLSLANAMEDVRIEMGGRDLYNGLPKAIDKTSHEVNTALLEKVSSGEIGADELNDFGVIGPVAVTWEGRKRLGYPSDTQQRCLDMVSDDVKRRASMIVDAIQNLKTGVTGMGEVNKSEAYEGCLELHKLAEKISNDYTTERNEQERDGNGDNGTAPNNERTSGGGRRAEDSEQSGPTNGTGNQGDDGSSTVPNPTSSTGHGTEADDQGQADKDTQSGDKPKQIDGTNPTHADVWTENNAPDPVSPELGQALDAIVNQVNQKTKNGYRVLNRNQDKWRVPKGVKVGTSLITKVSRTLDDKHGDRYYSNRLSNMSNKLGTMRRKLERALMSSARVRHESGKRTGKLDTRRLVNIMQFDPNVFRSKIETNAIDTAVSICVDLSGSMNGQEIELATDCCVAIGEALTGTNVSLEVTGHKTTIRMSGDRQRGGVKYNRTDGISMFMFKPFGKTMKQSRTALGNMPNCTGGANADGDSWLYAVERLAQRPEKRRIFIAMSDGRPAYSSDLPKTHYSHTSNCVAFIQQMGIDVVGIGILDDCVRQFFPRYVVVQNLDDLTKQVMDQLGKLLLGERFAVDNSDLIKGVARNVK